jgi:serine/threonine-protein kinase PknK
LARVLVVSTIQLVGDLLVRVLCEAGVDAVGCEPDPLRLFEALEAGPDVLLVAASSAVPVENATAMALEVRRRWPRLVVVAISDHYNLEAARELLDPPPRGAALLLTQTIEDVGELVEAIERALDGEIVVDGRLVTELTRRARARDDLVGSLSPGELEVLELMAQGRSNAGIARRLSLSGHTIEKRVTTILIKLRIPENPDDNRRILAVLDFLSAQPL